MLLWLDTFTLQYGAFQIQTEIYGISVGDIYAYLYAIVAAALIFFLDGVNYLRYMVHGALAAVVGFIAFILFPGTSITFFRLIISALGMGLLAASSCYIFFMILNNTEKFYAMVIVFSIARLMFLIKPYTDIGIFDLIITKGIPVALLFGLLICTIFFRTDITILFEQSKKSKIPIGAYSVLFIVMAVFVLNEGVVPAILKTTKGIAVQDIERLYTAGAIAGVIILLFFQPILKRSIWHMWNLSFSILALGFIINYITSIIAVCICGQLFSKNK